MATRERRTTAGRNRWYNEREYCLVSFRGHEKHALLPTTVVDQDPIDNGGTVTIGGRRREIFVIAKGKTFFHHCDWHCNHASVKPKQRVSPSSIFQCKKFHS